jgi:hypothetical protein
VSAWLVVEGGGTQKAEGDVKKVDGNGSFPMRKEGSVFS